MNATIPSAIKITIGSWFTFEELFVVFEIWLSMIFLLFWNSVFSDSCLFLERGFWHVLWYHKLWILVDFSSNFISLSHVAHFIRLGFRKTDLSLNGIFWFWMFDTSIISRISNSKILSRYILSELMNSLFCLILFRRYWFRPKSPFDWSIASANLLIRKFLSNFCNW